MPWYWPRLPVLGVILLYQHILSPDHSFWSKVFFPGGYCKFSPSCSEYGYQVVKKQGVICGVPKMLWRIMRCNPWTRGGEDAP